MIFQRSWRGYAPPWFRARWLSTFYESIGAILDGEAQRVLDGRLAAIPYAGTDPGAARLSSGQRIECQPDAFPFHSADRRIALYSQESDLSKRIRLSRFRQLHRARGTHWGEIDHVRPYFSSALAYPTFYVVFQTNEVTPSAVWYKCAPDNTRTISVVSPSNFNYDNRPSLRTRWWAFVDLAGTGYTLPITYGSGHTYGDGSEYGVGGANPFAASNQADVATMFRDWKSASSWCGGVVLIWPGYTAINPAGTPTQDADGRWSLPNGKWGSLVDPGTGKATRPYGWQWILDNPA